MQSLIAKIGAIIASGLGILEVVTKGLKEITTLGLNLVGLFLPGGKGQELVDYIRGIFVAIYQKISDLKDEVLGG